MFDLLISAAPNMSNFLPELLALMEPRALSASLDSRGVAVISAKKRLPVPLPPRKMDVSIDVSQHGGRSR